MIALLALAVFHIDVPVTASLLATLVTGGGAGAWLNHLRATRKQRIDGFERFYVVWREEDQRREDRHRAETDKQQQAITGLEAKFIAKVDHLERVVVALSDEVLKLGGDPLSIRRCLAQPATIGPEDLDLNVD